MHVPVLIVGAGFTGSVCAERLAANGTRVLIVDQRSHVGGNAYDRLDADGVLIHVYGPHIFHTNSQRVFDYLSRFTQWRFYEHRILARVGSELYPFPINRKTINRLYGLDHDEAGIRAYLDRVRERREPERTSEDVVLNAVGADLCDRFFRGYTRKQWGLDLAQLAPEVARRIVTRTGDDDRCFGDEFQFMPADGYTAMFGAMLDHPNIEMQFGVDFADIRNRFAWDHLIYTGPIDAYFDYRHGALPYRSLRFEHEHLPAVERFQPVGTVNYPNEEAFTRITEFKHLTGQIHAGTSIMREYPQSEGEPFYPIPRPENAILYQRYQALAAAEGNATFVGRLAQYRYYNMDQAVGAALKAVGRLGVGE
ncbi:MAG: UDP-galactopyranose mutase [Dongiaceae bacterium]